MQVRLRVSIRCALAHFLLCRSEGAVRHPELDPFSIKMASNRVCVACTILKSQNAEDVALHCTALCDDLIVSFTG